MGVKLCFECEGQVRPTGTEQEQPHQPHSTGAAADPRTQEALWGRLSL